jgi:hypothetical protein
MTTKTKIVPENMGKPQHNNKPADKTHPGSTASTYYANSRWITGTHHSHSSPAGPTSYTDFVISKKGRKK